MSTYERLKKLAQSLPPMTEEQRLLQGMDFAYGSLACTTNHKPSRDAFRSVALGRGMSPEAFDRWASDKEWWVR